MLGFFNFRARDNNDSQQAIKSSTPPPTPRKDSSINDPQFGIPQPLNLDTVMSNIMSGNGVLTSQQKANGRDVDLLLQLFQSEFFDTWMAVVYLHRYDKKSGVHDYLSNQLYNLPYDEIEFYLPQITNLLIYRLPSDNLSKLTKFLLRRAKQSTHFALIFAALLESIVQDNFVESVGRAKKIRHKLMQVMNGEKKVDPVSDSTSDNSAASIKSSVSANLQTDSSLWTDRDEESSGADSFQVQTVDAAELCMNCEERANVYCGECDEYYCNECGRVFHKNKSKRNHQLDLIALRKYSSANMGISQAMMFNDCRTFIDVLSEIAAHMISLLPQNRTLTLRSELEKLNHAIPSPFNGDAILFSALYIPMQLLASKNTYRILSINVNECVCFSSKERAPFLLIMEVLQTDRSQYPNNNGSNGIGSNGSNNNLPSCDELDTQCSLDSGNNAASTPPTDGMTSSVSTGEINLSQLVAERKSKLRPIFGEMWEDKKQRLKKASAFGHLPNWHVVSMIFKYGDDIRQEALAVQLIQQFKIIFEQESLPLYLRPYHIVVTSNRSAFVETVTDAVSIDSLKKKFPNFVSLADYFQRVYSDEFSFREAQKNFVESMAGYSIVCYILQIKDRHNGNLMLDKDGRIIHIDFGFILDHSPGSINFEGTCFKLTKELIDVMGGVDSDMFQYFRSLVLRGFLAIKKHCERIVTLAEMMLPGQNMAFFAKGGGERVIQTLRERFNVNKPETEFIEWVYALVEESIDNWRTRKYDEFQRLTNGIL